jgi:hypothetical protein
MVSMQDFIMERMLARNSVPLPVPAGSDPRCPPLFQFGGGQALSLARETGSAPLVIVSLEPLLDEDTNPEVCRRVVEGLAASPPRAALQLEFFSPSEFPAVLPHPIPYWRNIHGFLAGWLGQEHPAPFSWQALERCIIELPYSPHHARSRTRPHPDGTKPPQLRRTAELDHLLRERVRLVIAEYRPATLLVLGVPPLEALKETFPTTVFATAAKPRVPSGVGLTALGAGRRFLTQWHSATLEMGDCAVPVFARRAPFTNRYMPTKQGLWWLGHMLRDIAEARVTWSDHFDA